MMRKGPFLSHVPEFPPGERKEKPGLKICRWEGEKPNCTKFFFNIFGMEGTPE